MKKFNLYALFHFSTLILLRPRLYKSTFLLNVIYATIDLLLVGI